MTKGEIWKIALTMRDYIGLGGMSRDEILICRRIDLNKNAFQSNINGDKIFHSSSS